MATFQPGEIVDITIKGARVESHDGDGMIVNLGGTARITIPVVLPSDSATVTVEGVAPAEWPPQPGDLWRSADGRVWFAADRADYNYDSADQIVMISEGAWRYGDDRTPQDLNRNAGPLTLVRREGGAS
ncbi:MAG TPA: hypothetical protein VIS06_22075 [Mycobacteriales bacterium]